MSAAVDPKKSCTVRTRKFLLNKLLQRKQMIIDVLHLGRPNVSKEELKQKMAKMYNVQDANCIYLFGFQTAFGGGKSSGFCLIYDNITAAKKYEPKYRLIRQGLLSKIQKSSKQRKEKKNRAKKARGKFKWNPEGAAAKKKKSDK